MTNQIYAIGDIHGQLALLKDVLALIERDSGPEARIVFLGDYVDRGPDSRGVIELLSRGLAEGRNWICLKGNHDRLFEWFIAPPVPRQDPHLLVGYHWFHERIGGIETAASYGIGSIDRMRQNTLAADMRAAVPDSHLRFLQGLRPSHAEAGKFFAHAGVRPGVPLDRQDEDDLLWIRKEFLQDDSDHGDFVVHGHTPVDAPDRRANRLNLDTGAAYGGPLTAAVFEGDEICILGPTGRIRL